MAQAQSRPSVRAFGSGARLGAVSAHGFSGTFDFKWPLATRIRVIFQEPLFADRALFHHASQIVEEVALLWVKNTSVTLDFSTYRGQLFPRPPFPPEPYPYEVLVSLDDLPVLLPEKKGQPQEEQVVLPSSMLGTYALRMDYGDPTVYLGYAFAGRDGTTGARARGAYFDSAEFRASILHEFGHVLGLAHEHQNPRRYPPGDPARWPPWRSEEEIAQIVRARWGVEVEPDFLRAEVTQPWPCLRDEAGEPMYSDWREPEKTGDLWDFDSVMVIPGYKEFLRAPYGRSEALRDWFARHQTPTASDLDFIQRMYPRLG